MYGGEGNRRSSLVGFSPGWRRSGWVTGAKEWDCKCGCKANRARREWCRHCNKPRPVAEVCAGGSEDTFHVTPLSPRPWGPGAKPRPGGGGGKQSGGDDGPAGAQDAIRKLEQEVAWLETLPDGAALAEARRGKLAELRKAAGPKKAHVQLAEYSQKLDKAKRGLEKQVKRMGELARQLEEAKAAKASFEREIEDLETKKRELLTVAAVVASPETKRDHDLTAEARSTRHLLRHKPCNN